MAKSATPAKAGRKGKTDAEKAEATKAKEAAAAARKAQLEAMTDEQRKEFRNTEKAAAFRKLGSARATKAVRMIGQLTNLANKNSYSYTAEQAEKLVSSLTAAVAKVKNAFAGTTDKQDEITL